MHFKNDMKNLPQTEWIELRQKQKKKLERQRRSSWKGEEKIWKRWNKISADDVSIVYCNAPNVKWRGNEKADREPMREKEKETRTITV